MRAVMVLALALLAPSGAALAAEHLDLRYLKWMNSCRGCDLTSAQLNGANLAGADLREADLRGASLAGADLQRANLDRSQVGSIHLCLSELENAPWPVVVTFEHLKNPSELDRKAANLSRVNLSEANIRGASLCGVDLTSADLRRVNGAPLPDVTSAAIWPVAMFAGANLTDARLTQAELDQSVFTNATLRGANFFLASLHQTTFNWCDARSADFTNADFSQALLVGTDFQEAKFFDTDLSGALLLMANLSNAIFEPRSDRLPDLANLRRAVNLHETRFQENPDALIAIRTEFFESGRRDLERQITFAIKRSEREHAGPIEAAFSYALFEITSDYGMSPGRPLTILGASILLMSGVYWWPLRQGVGRAGIWQQFAADRVHQDEGSATPRRLVCRTIFRRFGTAIYFSLLSAFHIGWRELNVGNWIARINPREYTLRATGWVRVVSGIQSLVSVYLLALWALTYFGRPFD